MRCEDKVKECKQNAAKKGAVLMDNAPYVRKTKNVVNKTIYEQGKMYKLPKIWINFLKLENNIKLSYKNKRL